MSGFFQLVVWPLPDAPSDPDGLDLIALVSGFRASTGKSDGLFGESPMPDNISLNAAVVGSVSIVTITSNNCQGTRFFDSGYTTTRSKHELVAEFDLS